MKNYKDRFYALLESKMGNVKPLISEDDYLGKTPSTAISLPNINITATSPAIANIKDVFVKKDGTVIKRINVPQGYLKINPEGGCYAIRLDTFYLKTDHKETVNIKDLEKKFKSGEFDLKTEFDARGCKDRLIPKTEEDLLKPGYFLTIGDSGPLVRKIQQLLINYAEGYAHMLFPESKKGDPTFNPLDGKFGQATKSAVKQFQIDSGITPTGNVGSKTWTKLKDTKITKDWKPGEGWWDIENNKPAVST